MMNGDDQGHHRSKAQEFHSFPDSKVHEANMGPIWGRQDPGGPHVGPMNFAIWIGSTQMILAHSESVENISS